MKKIHKGRTLSCSRAGRAPAPGRDELRFSRDPAAAELWNDHDPILSQAVPDFAPPRPVLSKLKYSA